MSRILLTAGACVLAVTVEPLASERLTGLTGAVQSYVVARGDTTTSVSARFGVDPRVVIADNGLPPSGVLVAGRTLQVDSRHVVPGPAVPGVVVINVPQRMLFYAEDDVVAAMPVAVGRRTWPTPLGAFTVVNKRTDPTWHVPASILEESRRAGRVQPPIVPPGPNNPLGRFWLGLSGGGIGIHGTNAPASIYRSTTHGCVRVHPDDIAWLFPRVAESGAVRIIYEPVLLTTEGARVFLEVHPDVYRRAPDALRTVRTLADAAAVSDLVDWDLAATVIADRHGVARDVTGPR